MKKLIAIVLISASLISPAFAASGKTTVSKTTLDHFSSDYNGATGIWDTHDSYDEVLFFWHNILMQSYYDKSGELIGTFHHVEASTLPAKGLNTIQTKYKNYLLKETDIMDKPGQDSAYYVTLVGPSKILTVQISLDGEVSIVDTQK